MKKETLEAFYARNAAKGRTSRFKLDLDSRHVPKSDADAVGLGQLQIKMGPGTLTPRAAAIIFAATQDDWKRIRELLPEGV